MKMRAIALLGAFVCLAAPALADDGPPAVAGPGAGARVEVTGTFHVVWGDPPPGSTLPPRHEYFLTDDQGRLWDLEISAEQLEAAGGMTTLHLKTVEVAGRGTQGAIPSLAVESLALSKDRRTPGSVEDLAISGPKPYVWILLRFSDNTTTPEPSAWFQTQATGAWPSLDTFWREVSFNNINIVGSSVVGWYNLPHPRSHYVYDIDPSNPGDEADLTALFVDGVTVADSHVNFNNFVGINLIFNGNLDCCAWGGARTYTLDGTNKSWPTTWMPPWGWRTQGILGHEMGHALGLPHSSGPYTATYDSQWDVMSSATGTAVVTDATYGAVGEHTIAYHKDKLGWIHASHKREFTTAPFVATMRLDELVVPPAAGGYLMARTTWPGDTTRSYTFERRKFHGYDRNVADEAVVIHSIDPARSKPANVVDVDVNGNCNDEGARWDPGETFWDSTHGIMMTVEWANANSSMITLTNRGRSVVYVDKAFTGSEHGTSTAPWNTVWEGQGGVYPTGTVYIAPGSYNEQMKIVKHPITLRRWGTSGNVVIGQ